LGRNEGTGCDFPFTGLFGPGSGGVSSGSWLVGSPGTGLVGRLVFRLIPDRGVLDPAHHGLVPQVVVAARQLVRRDRPGRISLRTFRFHTFRIHTFRIHTFRIHTFRFSGSMFREDGDSGVRVLELILREADYSFG
jgi:hypothetical protein